MSADLFTHAEEQARMGMARALVRADRAELGWSDQAYAFLCAYARQHDKFISEDVSDASKAAGFPQPPTDRAWGQVYRRAAKAGIICTGGVGRSRRRHGSVCPLWRSRIWR